MANEPVALSLKIENFGPTVAPRGGFVEGTVKAGEHLGKTALVRLDMDDYEEFLQRPEIAPHVQTHSHNENEFVRDPDDPERMKVALKPVFEYPAGGSPASMDEICGKLGNAHVVLEVDHHPGPPGMKSDPDRIVGNAVSSLLFGNSETVSRPSPHGTGLSQ